MIWKRKARHQDALGDEGHAELVLFAAIAKDAGVPRPYQRAADVMLRHRHEPKTAASAQAVVHELRAGVVPDYVNP